MRSPWMSTSYKKLESSDVVKLSVEVDSHKFIVVLNTAYGSWVAMTPSEFEAYERNLLTELEMENLYLRCLATDDKGNMVSTNFPEPAEWPNVVVVNLTTSCNLRCKYCFADCVGEGDDMPPPVMKRIIEEMFSMPSPLIIFELQGGEPLCHMEGMKNFIQMSEDMRKLKNKRVQYRTVTNATLIDDDFIALAKRYNIAVCVSVDGPDFMTNQMRCHEDGKGAFDEIMSGVKKLRENGLEVDGAVCTLGQHNVSYPEQIVDFFAQNHISFKPRPANVLGREIKNRTTTRPGQWYDAYVRMYRQSQGVDIDNYSIHIHEENVYTPIRDYICLRYPCGAAREVISVNPDGSVYPCDGFKGEKNFVMGNIMEESLGEMLKKDWVVQLRNRVASDIPKCSKCVYRAMCCSCCYSAYGAFGSVYREDPQCADRRKIFMFLIKEWIRKNMF